MSCVSEYLKTIRQILAQGRLCKLKQNGISGNLLESFNDFLKDQK